MRPRAPTSPVEGVENTRVGLRWDRLLASLHPFVPLDQKRLDIGMLLLAQQRLAELGPGIERHPEVGLLLLGDARLVGPKT